MPVGDTGRDRVHGAVSDVGAVAGGNLFWQGSRREGQMTTIDDIRERRKDGYWGDCAGCAVEEANQDIDALFAEIERLERENVAMKVMVTAAEAIANHKLDKRYWGDISDHAIAQDCETAHDDLVAIAQQALAVYRAQEAG